MALLQRENASIFHSYIINHMSILSYTTLPSQVGGVSDVFDGKTETTILWAEGFSPALEKIYGMACAIDDKTKSLQYQKALTALDIGPVTKFVLPCEAYWNGG